MSESIEARLKALARRAGLAGATPAAVAAALVLCGLVIALAAWRWWPRASAEVPASPVAERTAGGRSLPGAEPGAGGGAEPGAGQGKEPGAGKGAGEPGSGATGESGAASSTVYVHVVGAVRHAGMYALADGARVADAVAAAGGLAGNAAQAGVNLARPVADGEQVAVPTLDEVARGTAPAGGAAPPAGGAVQAGGGGAGSSAGPVNINTADAAALDVLPGVGPSTAQKIVADREANGPFTSPDDLGRVAGIGPKKLEELRPRVCVR